MVKKYRIINSLKSVDIWNNMEKKGGKHMLKKYEGKNNVLGNLLFKYRFQKGFSKAELSRKLELHAIYVNPYEIGRMEKGLMLIKDFELIGFWDVLEIPAQEILNCIE
jgi:ribosome-binding protein aMBF1 (putative translation factor)